MLRTLRLQQRRLLGFAHNVHEANAVFQADPVQHLPQIGCRCRVHQRLVPFEPHGLHHAERGQRIDKTRSAISRRAALGQQQALVCLDTAVLRIHGATQNGHRFAQQGLRCRRAASRHHHTGAFVAHRQRLAQSASHGLHGRWWNLHRHHRMRGRARQLGTTDVTRAKQQADVRRIDRCGFNPYHHFICTGHGCGYRDQRNLQHALGFDEGLQLKAGGGGWCQGGCHYLSLLLVEWTEEGFCRSHLRPRSG